MCLGVFPQHVFRFEFFAAFRTREGPCVTVHEHVPFHVVSGLKPFATLVALKRPHVRVHRFVFVQLLPSDEALTTLTATERRLACLPVHVILDVTYGERKVGETFLADTTLIDCLCRVNIITSSCFIVFVCFFRRL